MRNSPFLVLVLAVGWASAQAQPAPAPTRAPGPVERADSLNAAPVGVVPRDRLQVLIQQHLGRPYAWGSCGLKSFDCSGFIWRVLWENGIPMKRTTARKLYMVLPKVDESNRWRFGNIVFFSSRKHCGIVDSRETFYHAQTSKGTNLSRFDPLWRGKIDGVRALPQIVARDTARDH